MDSASLLLGLVIGGLIGGLAVAVAAGRSGGRLREELARARAELAAQADVARLQRESFVALSSDVLQSTQRSFLDLVRPVEQSLQQVDEKLRLLEREREGAYRELKTQVADMGRANDRLRTETATLAQALRAPHTRGRWGEIHLRRVVELAGMQPHCDFTEQTTVNAEGGVLRPDMIVSLPGGRRLVVDAKVPLTSYLEAQETTDDTLRAAKLADHARQVRDRIARLSLRSYAAELEATPEFVVLFIPGEAFFAAAVERDPELLEFAFSKGVVLASPTNLVALLKTVHYAWQQEKVAAHAEEIRELGATLHDRVATMTSHFRDLGAGLDGAVKAYNQAMASLASRVLVTARKMREMGAGSGKEIADPEPLEREARPVGTE
ncbi:MAG TPA: DNA recombination protein RmuC [Candidatus Polarisedimenticolaceae bacterium]|nr:DNA recombination protein RmuC [Candidatus Polarisedimenticolaceae bacterium]